MSYQEVTGCLTNGAHPGACNGQDAYSDMLITEERNVDLLERRTDSRIIDGEKLWGGAKNAGQREF